MKPEKWGLPENAKRVFEGVIWSVWQWEQKMFDGSVRTFEAATRPDWAAVIPTVGDKILITKENQPDKGEFLSLSGGICEEGESGLETAKRELMEECGMKSEEWEEFETFDHGHTLRWWGRVFVARNCVKEGEPQDDAGEKIEPKLISFEEFLMLADEPKFRVKHLNALLLRARLNEEEKEKLRVRIFGK